MNRKIPSRFTPYVFVFLVAMPLSGTLSFINTFLQEGFQVYFLSHWLKNWLIGFVMVYPLALFFVRLARKIITHIIEP